MATTESYQRRLGTSLFTGCQQDTASFAEQIRRGNFSEQDRIVLADLVERRGWQSWTDEEYDDMRADFIARTVMLETFARGKQESAIAFVRSLFEPGRQPSRSTVFEILKRERPKLGYVEQVIKVLGLLEKIKEAYGVNEIEEASVRFRENMLCFKETGDCSENLFKTFVLCDELRKNW
jgi:hypothetical protein